MEAIHYNTKNHTDEILNESVEVVPVKKSKIRYPGDVNDDDFNDPLRAKAAFDVALKFYIKEKQKNELMRKQRDRYVKKIQTLSEAIEELKSKQMISEETGNILYVNIHSLI